MVAYEDLTDEQQRAVDTLDRSIALTAGAGTGKTTTLTARYLRMIESSIEAKADDSETNLILPQQILTTTFTERAANELEASIREEIVESIEDRDPAEFDAWRTIADELENGYIHTLHGFCARLLRENGLSVEGIDPGFEPIDENEAQALMHQVVGDVLEEYESHEATHQLAQRFTRRQLQGVLRDLLGSRPESIEWANRWVDETKQEYLDFVQQTLHPIDAQDAADRLSDPAVTDAVKQLTSLVLDPPDISTDGTKWKRAVDAVEQIHTQFDDGIPTSDKQATLAQLSQALTTGEGDRYASYAGAKSHWNGNPKKKTFDAAIEQLVEAIEPEKYAIDVDFTVDANSFPLVTALAKLTLAIEREYNTRKQQQNVLDFTDLISNAVAFLQDDRNERVRKELQAQFEYVMIDEFQDTDPRQWDLIKLLTETTKGTFDAENIFIVGDGKQSIYRFRNADVSQFHETAEALSENGSNDDQLSTNFRTLAGVLNPINELFDTVFTSDGESYEAVPQPLTAERDDQHDIGSVEYLLVPTNREFRQQRFGHYPAFANADPDTDAELEAMALAGRLSQVLAEPTHVYPEDDASKPPRPIEASDIAVLIRSRTNLKAYERAFDNADIPYSIASGLGFYETPEITALLNLFRALADPSDDRALYGALRSPLFGCTDDTLARLTQDNKPLWEALAGTSTEELSDVSDQLQSWRRDAGLVTDVLGDCDESWAAFLTRVINDTGYLLSVSAGDRGEQARSNVEKFREQLRGMHTDGRRSMVSLVDHFEQRIELGGRESEADTTSDGVQILTIHDAKGMEFPYVVIPGISKEFNDRAALGNGSVEFEEINGEHAIGLKAPSPDDPFEMDTTVARQTLREQRRNEERAEEKRILYVACTRARDHLLLTGTHSFKDENQTSFNGLTEPDTESVSSWRDWVQPELLTESICEQLDQDNHATQSYGTKEISVTLPAPKAGVDQTHTPSTPDLALSPTPTQPDIRFNLSATDLAALFGGYGELHVDSVSRLATVQDVEESPDNRHGEPDRLKDQDESNTQEWTGNKDSVSSRTFGELVHRLCELRPPPEHWNHVLRQTLADESVEQTALTPALQQRVRTHAEYGIEYVREQAVTDDATHQYDELYVTAQFERGEIAGYIDHLIVSSDAYHIIDYKTGSMAESDLDNDAAYYANQMQAYAIALYQQDPTKRVRISVVFTDIKRSWSAQWDCEQLAELEQTIEKRIYSLLPGH